MNRSTELEPKNKATKRQAIVAHSIIMIVISNVCTGEEAEESKQNPSGIFVQINLNSDSSRLIRARAAFDWHTQTSLHWLASISTTSAATPPQANQTQLNQIEPNLCSLCTLINRFTIKYCRARALWSWSAHWPQLLPSPGESDCVQFSFQRVSPFGDEQRRKVSIITQLHNSSNLSIHFVCLLFNQWEEEK